MATLERISFVPMRESVHGGIVRWEPDRLAYPIANLPQIYWEDGRPWSEANHWALTKAQAISGGHIKTVTSLMKHLAAYASWLELADMDWRHFPSRYSDRAIVQFRGALIFQRDKLHTLAPSTTTARMRAVIQFYRHAQVFGFVQKHSPMWVDRQVVVRIHDSVGFERTMILKSSNLAIPNRARAGGRLEDGLTPLREEDLVELLKFSDGEGLLELHYMLALGIMSGARFETITTLRKNSIKDALPAAELPGFYKIRVGPGTGVRTKFDVAGELLVPAFLIDALKGFADCFPRLKRQAIATEEHRECLFLTVRGNPYEAQTFSRLMTDLRRRACAKGLRFMESFKFHQTRASFGTMLMGLALQETSVSKAVAFVREAMLHKDEATTLKYVTFLQKNPMGAAISNEFSSLFSGLVSRDWNKFDA